MSKLEIYKHYVLKLVQVGGGNRTHTCTNTKVRETKNILRDLPTLNPGESRNQRKVLLEMANISGGSPSTIWMECFMVCT